MFACGTGSMRGPRVKTPLLLLLLLLLGSLTGTVLSQSDGEEPEVETPEEEPSDPDEGVEDPIPTESDATSTTSSIPPEENTEQIHEEDTGSGLSRSFNPPALSTVEPDPESSGSGSTELPEDGGEGTEEDVLNPIIILIPVVLVVIIIAMIVCGIFISRRLNRNRNQNLGKEDPYLDGSSTEKVPMPMFEEDVPSVLELEMEELDQWMKKDVEPVECNCN